MDGRMEDGRFCPPNKFFKLTAQRQFRLSSINHSIRLLTMDIYTLVMKF